MKKKTRQKWQIYAKCEMGLRGIGYKEVAKAIDVPVGTVGKAMCTDGYPGVREKICKYLNVEAGNNEQ